MIDIFAELRRDNTSLRTIDIQIYADALRIYCEAAENILKNGAVCSHPRTGAPLENPYLKIQAAQGIILNRMKQVNSDRVLKMLRAGDLE